MIEKCIKLLVQWVSCGRTMTEILKAMRVRPSEYESIDAKTAQSTLDFRLGE
jgi:hypothetical protein